MKLVSCIGSCLSVQYSTKASNQPNVVVSKVILAALVAVALAAPVDEPAPVAIVSSNSELNEDGSFSYGSVPFFYIAKVQMQ